LGLIERLQTLHSFTTFLSAPARWRFIPDLLRAVYALVLKRLFGLFKRPMLADIPGIGLMRLEPWDLIDSRIFFFHVWEPAITKFMASALKPGMVVADIGANIGYYTLLMSRAVGPEGHVFAVEPSPEIRARLEDALALNKVTNVTVIPYGISDRSERRAFHLSEANLGASKFGGEVAEGGIELRRIADVITSEMLARLAFIKVDVEGMEPAVMRDIRTLMPQLPKALTLCAELRMDEEIAQIVRDFQRDGMECLLLPNDYSMFSYPTHPLESRVVDDPGRGQLDVALIRR
jgi:FkbM family methyltransferase